MKNFGAIAFASMVAAVLSGISGRNITREEFIVLIILLPVFRLAIGQICEHYAEYIETGVEILRSCRTAAVKFLHFILNYDWKALALRILTTLWNLGRNVVTLTIKAAKATYRFIRWAIAAVEKADIPTKANALVDRIIAANIPEKVDAALEFMAEKARHGHGVAVKKIDEVKPVVKGLVEKLPVLWW